MVGGTGLLFVSIGDAIESASSHPRTEPSSLRCMFELLALGLLPGLRVVLPVVYGRT
jgi:hypothetical protein